MVSPEFPGYKAYLIFALKKRHWYPPWTTYWDYGNPCFVEVRGGKGWEKDLGEDGIYTSIAAATSAAEFMAQEFGYSGGETKLPGRWRTSYKK